MIVGLLSVAFWGGILSLLMTALILFLMWYRPRLLLHHHPDIIQKAVPPRSEAEKRSAIAAAFLSLPLVVGLPVLVSIASPLTPVEAFFHAVGIVLVFGLVDLILIDWLIICKITPSFVIVPGTKGSAGYKDYCHHAVGFLRGLPLAAGIGLVTAVAASIRGYLNV